MRQWLLHSRFWVSVSSFLINFGNPLGAWFDWCAVDIWQVVKVVWRYHSGKYLMQIQTKGTKVCQTRWWWSCLPLPLYNTMPGTYTHILRHSMNFNFQLSYFNVFFRTLLTTMELDVLGKAKNWKRYSRWLSVKLETKLRSKEQTEKYGQQQQQKYNHYWVLEYITSHFILSSQLFKAVLMFRLFDKGM